MGIFDSLFGKKEKKNILFNNESLKNAVEEWQENNSKAEKKYGHISNWNVSNVTDMYSLFSYDKYSDNEHQPFNEDISNWDVSNVENMSHLFFCNESFNQDISKWNVSKVKNMWRTFYRAKSFNQDISKWDVSSVTEMQEMFDIAESFNQDISNWNVIKVENMSQMFNSAKSFNQDISKWNVSKVKNMERMFACAKSFNQDIGGWNVSNVTDMCEMFSSANSFNQDISNWNVIKVENMSHMFNGAESFKQDLSKWNLKGMEGATEYIVEYLNSYSTKKIIIDKKTKKQLKERGGKVIELMINDIKIKTTIKKLETAEKNNFNGFYDYDDDYNLELSDDFEEVCMFLNEITNEKLIVRAEYWAEDSEIGGIGIEEVSYLNCECPDNLKKYYNGELFITDRGKMLETKSDDYKKINFDKIWDDAEISNSGVICEKFDDYIKNI
jgi:surface protein